MRRVGIASFVVGAALAVFFVVMIVRSAPSMPKPIGDGVVHVSKKGLTLWASQPGVKATCEVKTAGGVDVPLEVESGSESLEINGTAWYLVARSTEVVPAGDYVVNCIDDGSDTTYAVARRSSIGIFVLSILGLVFSVLIFVILGTTLLAAGSRRSKRNPNITFRDGPPNYPPPGGPQYGPPGPQGNTFPGYPPPNTYNPGPNPDRPQDRPQDS
ncbi:hypothetical protein [Streptomyces sp. SID13031]|uniref:hypothetical protein n=1 Tax=Streptomyces sp. SID13031 TaxID=2706046 RepID=UPI0013CC6D08|nr:hypothetical protein [Streptomyces sp. SID13031]NEA36600.1 hypothetical protein [Streptomyces sp. SID13031]